MAPSINILFISLIISIISLPVVILISLFLIFMLRNRILGIRLIYFIIFTFFHAIFIAIFIFICNVCIIFIYLLITENTLYYNKGFGDYWQAPIYNNLVISMIDDPYSTGCIHYFKSDCLVIHSLNESYNFSNKITIDDVSLMYVDGPMMIVKQSNNKLILFNFKEQSIKNYNNQNDIEKDWKSNYNKEFPHLITPYEYWEKYWKEHPQHIINVLYLILLLTIIFLNYWIVIKYLQKRNVVSRK